MASTSTGVTSEESTSAAKHRCEMCETFFENETHLFSHYNGYHKIDNKYVCNRCDYISYFLGDVRVHVRKNHSHVVTYCGVCNKQFNNLQEYKNHLNVHKFKKSRKFICDKCEKLFDQFSILVTHYKEDHLKVHVCEMCNVSCENHQSLVWHYCEYHKKKNKFVCNKCDHKTSSFIHLKNHVTIHHTYIVKYCVICDNHFYSYHKYKNHKNVHIFGMSNMFRCSLCMTVNTYSTFNCLVVHHKRTHLNKPCDVR